MPVKVWRPPLIWRDGLIACNGVGLAVADFPDLFTVVGYTDEVLARSSASMITRWSRSR